MSFNRIMFRDAELETAGAETTTQTEAPSIASLMAKHGVQNNSPEPIAKPIDIPEKKEETKEPEKVTPAATATEPEKVVETKTESPAKKEETKVDTPKISEEPKVQKAWQEVLKEQPDTEVLKELGFDDKAIRLVKELNGFEKIDYFLNMIEEWKTTGSIDKYARELSTDYSKMTAQDVMRHQLRQEYPKASEKALDVLYRKEVVEKYNLESEDDQEKEDGIELLNAKADKFRDELVENQQKFLTPKRPEPKPEVKPDNSAQIERQKEVERIHKAFEESDYAKNIIGNKAFNLGEGEDKFNFPLNVEQVLGYIKDGDKTGELTFNNIQRNPDGTIKSGDLKPENEMLAAIFRIHGVDLLDRLVSHFKSKGGSKAIESIDNASTKKIAEATKSETEPTSVAGHMAKSGRLANPS